MFKIQNYKIKKKKHFKLKIKAFNLIVVYFKVYFTRLKYKMANLKTPIFT